MKKWAPQLAQSNALPVNKALAIMLTDIWERRDREKPPKSVRSPHRRSSRWKKGGYGVYDMRVLRKFGEWLKRVETDRTGHKDRTRYPTMEILDLIPYDGWVSSKEIAEQLCSTPTKVGNIIKHRLLHKYVESRLREHTASAHLYRRVR